MENDKSGIGFVLRFAIVHTVTYAIFGLLFMYLSNYFEVFRADSVLSAVMKPAEALSVRLAIPIQIIRGGLLGLAVLPFQSVIFLRHYGWLKLFFLLFVLTGVGAVITGPGSIEGYLYTNFRFDPIIGLPEIVLQMFVFSWIFYLWQGRETKYKNKLGRRFI